MHFCYVAMNWIQDILEENSLWQAQKREVIMSIQSKIWLALVVYLIYLWCMAFIIIMIVYKLL